MGTLDPQKTDPSPTEMRASLVRLAEKLKLPAGAADQMVALAVGLIGRVDVPAVDAFAVLLDPEHPEVHVLWRVSQASDKAEVRLQAALRAQAHLHELFGVSSARFARISSLFLRADAREGSLLRYCAQLWPATKSPKIAALFDAQALGQLNAPALVEEALSRLGFEKAWQAVSGAMPRGPELDEVHSLIVQLSSDDGAQVEVRVRHHELTPSILATAATVAPDADPERLAHFLRKVVGDRVDDGVSADTSLSFIGNDSTPVSTTLHIAVPGFVTHDGQAHSRVEAALGEQSAKLRGAAMEAVCGHELAAGVGLSQSLSLQSPGGRAVCQLSFETSAAVSPRAPVDAPSAVEPVEAMVHGYEAQPFSLHPFLQRMARGSVDVRHMWLMFSNVYAGLSQHFPRRLARVVLGVDDERIRCILTEQLYEELGSGDCERTHRRLFLKLLEALSPWKPNLVTPEMSIPGAHLSERLEATYFDPHPYVGVGAAIVIELLGKQVDLFLAEQFRRQQAVGMASLEWLTLHESLEVDHAGESLELATFIEKDDDRAAAWRGGRAIYTTGWLFFDDMYRLCFGT